MQRDAQQFVVSDNFSPDAADQWRLTLYWLSPP